MSGLYRVTLTHNISADAFAKLILGAWKRMPVDHIDRISNDGFIVTGDDLGSIINLLTQSWVDRIGSAFTLTFDVRPIFDSEAEDEAVGDAGHVFIRSPETEAKRMMDEMPEPLRDLFGEGRHEHNKRG